eukprot:5105239-Pleurochrysis_carterae.AAC.1
MRVCVDARVRECVRARMRASVDARAWMRVCVNAHASALPFTPKGLEHAHIMGWESRAGAGRGAHTN